MAATGVDAIAFADTGLSSGVRYYYRVRAAGAAGDSAESTVASAVTYVSIAVTYIATGAQWKYLDNGTDADTVWRGVGFNGR